MDIREPTKCHDCGVDPGMPHNGSCDVEICSVCGTQWIQCGHEKHDPFFARWTGWWPGSLEARALGITLNDLYLLGIYKYFFIKP